MNRALMDKIQAGKFRVHSHGRGPRSEASPELINDPAYVCFFGAFTAANASAAISMRAQHLSER